MEIKVSFKFKAETAGAYRYEEVDSKGNVVTTRDGAVIGALYLRKDKVEKAPKALTVTVAGNSKVTVEKEPEPEAPRKSKSLAKKVVVKKKK